MKETCNLLIENARKFLDPASLFQVCIMKGFLSMQRLGLCNKSSSINIQMSCLHLFLIGLKREICKDNRKFLLENYLQTLDSSLITKFLAWITNLIIYITLFHRHIFDINIIVSCLFDNTIFVPRNDFFLAFWALAFIFGHTNLQYYILLLKKDKVGKFLQFLESQNKD